MTGWFFACVYFGGIIPAYRHAKKNGREGWSLSLNALIWPADLGWNLAQKYCEKDKE